MELLPTSAFFVTVKVNMSGMTANNKNNWNCFVTLSAFRSGKVWSCHERSALTNVLITVIQNIRSRKEQPASTEVYCCFEIKEWQLFAVIFYLEVDYSRRRVWQM